MKDLPPRRKGAKVWGKKFPGQAPTHFWRDAVPGVHWKPRTKGTWSLHAQNRSRLCDIRPKGKEIAREVADSALLFFSKSDPKQLRTSLRLLKMQLGLLINFNAPLLKDGIIRIVSGLEDDPYRKSLRALAPSRED